MSSVRVSESYQRLGLKEGASLDQVKAIYKALALKLHPDKNLSNPEATLEFQSLADAYDRVMDHILSCPSSVGGAGSGFGPPNGFYSFGSARRGPARPSKPTTR